MQNENARPLVRKFKISSGWWEQSIKPSTRASEGRWGAWGAAQVVCPWRGFIHQLSLDQFSPLPKSSVLRGEVPRKWHQRHPVTCWTCPSWVPVCDLINLPGDSVSCPSLRTTATWWNSMFKMMDLGKSDGEGQILCDITSMWNPKYTTN